MVAHALSNPAPAVTARRPWTARVEKYVGAFVNSDCDIKGCSWGNQVGTYCTTKVLVALLLGSYVQIVGRI